MSSTFADTHNMVAILTKSDVSEGFNQIIDFLNDSYIKYALSVNPHIYVSCIKQFWNTVTVKQSNDVTRLQAIVDRTKVVLKEAVIRDVLCLDDAEGVNCLPNEEIFTGLARMGYEKPSTKLTFYKAFFLTQWTFLIHTLLQSLSDKRRSCNEFSSPMASTVICLSTGRKFNFSKYIFDSLVRNVDSSSKFYMYPRFIQLIIQNQIGDLSTYTTKYISFASTQKVFANMRRVGKGFSRVETPLFEGMLVVGENVEEGHVEEQVQDDDINAADQGTAADDTLQLQAQPQAADFPLGLLQTTLDACAALTSRIKQLESAKVSQALEISKLKKWVKQLEKDDTIMEDVSNHGRMIDELDKDEGVAFMGEKEEEKKSKKAKDIAGDDQEDEPAEVEEVVKVVTTAKLITEVVTATSKSVSAAGTTIPTAEPQVPAATPTVVPVRLAAASTRRRKGVIIKDPKEASIITKPTDTKSKDKGKGKMVEEPKPIKKKQHVELDEEYARKLHEELNKDIDWDTAIEHVKQKAKEDPAVLDYFKGMSYDDICLIFEAKFNTNIEFLLKSKEQIEEEERRAIESINETPAQKAAKRRKLNKEVAELNKHLEIVLMKTMMYRKVPVVDYAIILLNNKPHYKIIKVDGTYQLYVSFLALLKNFDRDDMESLWSIVKERFSTTKPDNFTDDSLLTTLGAMFEKADDQAQI
uniref:Xylulose kinase-1 n=1 Tax=Tanacetum cinerariifolium TaxID=118510 RepID=A0A6L2NQW0_TANCI|nr:hypothetical protein [Tanacetum cinerariifolium]